MQINRFFVSVKKAYERYDRFMEKQGFGIVLAVCVLIILSSALYTFHFRQQWAEEPHRYTGQCRRSHARGQLVCRRKGLHHVDAAHSQRDSRRGQGHHQPSRQHAAAGKGRGRFHHPQP